MLIFCAAKYKLYELADEHYDVFKAHLSEIGTEGLDNKPEIEYFHGDPIPKEIVEYNNKSWPHTATLEKLLVELDEHPAGKTATITILEW